MGDKPGPEYQLERANNNGSYCPKNCEWVTPKVNNRNKRNNRLVEFEGQTKTLTEWVELKGLTRSALTHRLNRGQDVGKALNTPLQVRK